MPRHEVNPDHTTNLTVPPPRFGYEGRHRKLWLEPSDAEELGLAGLLWLSAMLLGTLGIVLMNGSGL